VTAPFRSILIAGGAGFVGSNLAILLKQSSNSVNVTVMDNLKRRGSELNLPRLSQAGVEFLHADIRCREDFDTLPAFDLLIDCSAEPSVQVGLDGAPDYMIQTNLVGTINCLELARRNDAAFIFLSTSRVYPLQAINRLPYEETETRFVWQEPIDSPGVSSRGISEAFHLEGARSLYGASKLAAELLLQEYAFTYGMPVLINRCGVITGPWQMGKVDQGVVALWVARHCFDKPLEYIGYGGTGKQVRDILHVNDLFDLLQLQMRQRSAWDATPYNVGGGLGVSVSLAELTTLCQQVTGKQIFIGARAETSDVDIPIYLTDNQRVTETFGWEPSRSAEVIVQDIFFWMSEQRAQLSKIF
jgi:CDP-paratose 2-epimerase